MTDGSSDIREEYGLLAGLLRKRVEVIADAGWREADPASHWDALRGVSEAVFASHARIKGRIPPRLDHFLTNCSYEKALSLLESELIS